MDTTTFAHNKTFIEALNTPRHAEGQVRPTITISGETGAGAVVVAGMVASRLSSQQKNAPWAVFDRNLVEQVLADHQLPEKLKRFVPEDGGYHVQDAIEEMFGLHPSSWTLVQHTSETILRLATIGNVILVGRGSAFITSGLKNVLNVRLVAPFAKRLEHVQNDQQLNEEDAAKYIHKTDRARKRYVRYYLKGSIEDNLHYHLTINTGLVDFSSVANLIVHAIMNMHPS